MVVAALSLPLLAQSASGLSGAGEGAESLSRPVRSCETLLAVAFEDGARVTSAVTVPATADVPEHCQLTVVVPERINILVALPTKTWNGRYLALGNGGYAGAPMGAIKQPSDAVADGYVGSVTDTGHSSTQFNGEWAWSPTGMNYAQIQDFAYRANHEMAVKSKRMIEAYYGQGPAYSYWDGCSTGGREGLTEAMRYPDDFDGVVAGAPAINWTRFIPAGLWPQVAMQAGNRLPACKLAEFVQAFRSACDPIDGLKDGLYDPRACSFDPDSLIGAQTDCGVITATDAEVVAEIWRGPHRRTGERLWYGLYPGTDVGSTPAFTLGYSVPDTDGSVGDGLPFPVATEWFKWWLRKDPTWDWHTETPAQFEADFDQSVVEWADVLSTNSPDLSAFKESGGKMVIWHGMSDPLLFPQGSIDYYKRVIAHMGGLTRTQDFARLFLAPNVGHCGNLIPQFENGPTPDDPLAAVVDWVENGKPPATLQTSLQPRTGVNPTSEAMTRPLCPYPTVASYVGTGSTVEASNFACKKSRWSDQVEVQE
ncbi:MAG: tannase/feruloyl esterase family alpha/beta hydrolase [Actinomycetota bacterium]|nr:tannase/feruloyl esterase family alpha/beta hydrolase [Actinomycetota bacterium]